MPTQQYAFEKGGRKRLTLAWEHDDGTLTLELDGQPLGVIPTITTLDNGRDFRLPDGSVLTIRRMKKRGVFELYVLRNNLPLPGSESHPERRLARAYHFLIFTAVWNIIVGLFESWPAVNPHQTGVSVGAIATIVIGFMFAALAKAVMERSYKALTIAIGLYVLDALIVVGVALLGLVSFVFLFIVLVVRVFFILNVMSGFDALLEWDAMEVEAIRSSRGVTNREFSEPGTLQTPTPLRTEQTASPKTEISPLQAVFQEKLDVRTVVILIGLIVIGALLIVVASNLPPAPSPRDATATAAFIRTGVPPATEIAVAATQADITPVPTRTPIPTMTPTSIFEAPMQVKDVTPILFHNLNLYEAVYSLQTEKLVMLSRTPNQLHIFDAVGKVDTILQLPAQPRGLTLSPDGRSVVMGYADPSSIGHYRIAFVDLIQNKIVNVLKGPYANCGGFFPREFVFIPENRLLVSTCRIFTLALDSGEKKEFDIWFTRALLSPDQQHLYVMRGSEIGVYDSDFRPLIGLYASCGGADVPGFAFAEVDMYLIASCGDIVEVSSDYRNIVIQGRLAHFSPREVVIDDLVYSQAAKKIVLMPHYFSFDDHYLEIHSYDSQTFQLKSIIALSPSLLDIYYTSLLNRVFVNASGTQFYAISCCYHEGNSSSITKLFIGDL